MSNQIPKIKNQKSKNCKEWNENGTEWKPNWRLNAFNSTDNTARAAYEKGWDNIFNKNKEGGNNTSKTA